MTTVEPTVYRPIRVICHLERCCHHITATQVGNRFVLSIEGGRFDGAVFYCSTEESVMRLFDAVRDAVTSGSKPWFLQSVEVE